MESLRRAVYALQTAASKYQKLDETTQDSIAQLPSVLKLLELTKTSANVYHRLGSLLRLRAVPIYSVFPALGLRYFVAVLTCISDEKIIPAVKSQDTITKASWEGVQTALVSGVLDFLEAHPNETNRVAVAAAAYSTLLDIYLPLNPSLISKTRGDLLLAVYQLLLETVTSCAVNQRKLRDQEVLGGRRIGMVLSCNKDFLAIEALLQLFAKLLPSVAGGREKRTEFINQVFDPLTFSTGREIVGLLNSISSTDWDVTSLKIMDILAETDMGSPQPFGTKEIRINGSVVFAIDRIYVDHTALTANIEQEGQLETFQSPYSNIDKIRLSAPLHSKTNVTAYLSSSPFLGNTPLEGPSKETTLQLSFQLKGEEVERFIQVLKYRGLAGIISEAERKVSKAEAHVNLNFNSNERMPPISTQEKVQNIANLWNYHDTPGHVEPTSPLVVDHLEPAGLPPHQPLGLEGLEILKQPAASSKLPNAQPAVGHKSMLLAKPPEVDENAFNSDGVSDQVAHSEAAAKKLVVDAKRKRLEVIVIDDEDDAPPSKRRNERGNARITALDTAPVIPAARDARSTRRQTRGGKARTSSPEPMLDLEEVPQKSVDLFQDVSGLRKGKATAMKGKGGKAVKISVENKARKAKGKKVNHKAPPPPPPEHTTDTPPALSPLPPMLTPEPPPKIQPDAQMDGVLDMAHKTRLAPWDDPVFMGKSRERAARNLAAGQEKITSRASPYFDEERPTGPIPQTESTQRHLDLLTRQMSGKENQHSPLQPPVDTVITGNFVQAPLDEYQQERSRKLPSPIPIFSPPQKQSSPGRGRMPHLTVSKLSAPSYKPKTRKSPPAYTPTKIPGYRTQGLGGHDVEAGYAEGRVKEGHRTRHITKENHVPRILEVINEIVQVIVDRTSQRFEKVESDIHAGRMAILQETADKLREMRSESVDHFNTLIDLELEYASYHRKIIDGLEEFIKTTDDNSNNINDLIKNHDRHSLSKRFPTSLFPTSLPAILSKPDSLLGSY
ncbi:hypothetical protein BD779DRAFT_1784199 [Infundibulicybe gibba]|nr:hypothetical protein BD779DRAFT_1784199 [Infundibulicybe gibba]